MNILPREKQIEVIAALCEGVGIRTERLELDEAWSFVGKKQKNVQRHEINAKGDQYIFIGMAGTQKAIIGWANGRSGHVHLDQLR